MARCSQDFKSLPQASPRNFSAFVRNFILLSIFIVVASVIVATVCVFVFQPKHQIETKMTHLSSHYYEDIIIQNTLTSKSFSGDLAETLEKYHLIGLSPITLRQLSLIVKDDEYSSDIKYLTKHCDDEGTFVKFYPEPPYQTDSYRTEYTYSCDY